jgi:protein TonB
LLLFPFWITNAHAQNTMDGDTAILTFADKPPTFPGGEEKLNEFIKENLQYPLQAKEFDIQGKVYIQFIVEKDGRITQPVVKKNIGGGCDKEAIRLVRSFPKWKPGMQAGRPVRVYVALPISFILNDKFTH